MAVSTLIPSILGTMNFVMVPEKGTKLKGCSEFIRHSIACPFDLTFSCFIDSPLPNAILRLLFHYVYTCNCLCYRVFNLYPRIDFHEIKLIILK